MSTTESVQLARTPIEEVPCPLCGEDRPEYVMAARDRLFGRPETYGVVRCKSCDMRYLSPRPTIAGLSLHYPEEYFIYRTDDESHPLVRPLMRKLTAHRWSSYIRRFERVRGAFDTSTRIVDVGCGLNDHLATLKRMRGCQAVGIDFKPEVVSYVRAKYADIPIFEGTLAEAKLGDAEFDVVTMNEYLEHEPDPRGVLCEARRVTKLGGHLAVEIPFIDSLPSRIFGSRWAQIDAPRHLSHFSRATLADMLGRSGYRLIHTETFQIPMMIGASVLEALGHRGLGRMTLFDRLLISIASIPFWPLFPLMDEFVFAVARAE